MSRGQSLDSSVGLAFHPWHLSHLNDLFSLVQFIEVIPESIMDLAAGPEVKAVNVVSQHFPLTFHGVGLGLGGASALDRILTDKLRALTERYDPVWISEHCSFTSCDGLQTFELLALPHNKDRLNILCQNVEMLQGILGRRVYLENVSRYIDYHDDEMDDCTFLAETCRRTGCGLLFDVNNHVLNCLNRGLEITHGIDKLSSQDVFEIHYAGHSWIGDFRFDSHTLPASAEVHQLLDICLRTWGPKAVVLECDDMEVKWETIRDHLCAIKDSLGKATSLTGHDLCEPLNVNSARQEDKISQTTEVHLERELDRDRRAVMAVLRPRERADDWRTDLTASSGYRTHAYLVSHFSRMTLDILSTCLRPLERAYDRRVLMPFLEGYFDQHPPRDPLLYNNLNQIVNYAESRPSKDVPESRAVKWTWQAWQLLHEPLPELDLEKLGPPLSQNWPGLQGARLAASHCIVNKVTSLDFKLIEKLFPETQYIAPLQYGERNWVMLKTADNSIRSLIVSNIGLMLLSDLTTGRSVQEACEQRKNQIKSSDLVEVQNLFASLAGEMAL